MGQCLKGLNELTDNVIMINICFYSLQVPRPDLSDERQVCRAEDISGGEVRNA